MQLTCQVKDADTVFYSIKKRIAYCNATHLPGWRWRHSVLHYRRMNCSLQCNSPARLKMQTQCFTVLKNNCLPQYNSPARLKMETVFYSTEKWTVYCSATHLPRWRWRPSVLHYWRMDCLRLCNSPARLTRVTWQWAQPGSSGCPDCQTCWRWCWWSGRPVADTRGNCP